MIIYGDSLHNPNERLLSIYNEICAALRNLDTDEDFYWKDVVETHLRNARDELAEIINENDPNAPRPV